MVSPQTKGQSFADICGVTAAVDGAHNTDEFELPAGSLSAEVGHRIIGPLCYGFANWVADRARADGITQLYFLSRDGWLLKKAFDLLPAPQRAGLTSHYLYSSRRAVWFASLKADTPEAEYREILSGASPFLPVSAFLTRIFIEPSGCIDLIRQAGFENENSLIRNASDKEKLYVLFRLLKPQIVMNAASERQDYLGYLKQAGLFGQPKAALVDVGWTGSVLKYTRALVRDVDPSLELFGYFIGVGSMAKKKYGFDKNTCLHGYLFDFDDDTHRDILKGFFVIEKFLSPNEPSLVRMKRSGSVLKPVFEYGNQEVSPLNFIAQKSALEFVRSRSRSTYSGTFDLSTFVPLLKRLLTDPEPEVAALFSQYSYSSDFGYQAGAKPIASSDEPSRYFRNPLLLLRDYRRARWKPGFIAQQPFLARVLLKVIRRTRLDYWFDRTLLRLRALR